MTGSGYGIIHGGNLQALRVQRPKLEGREGRVRIDSPYSASGEGVGIAATTFAPRGCSGAHGGGAAAA